MSKSEDLTRLANYGISIKLMVFFSEKKGLIKKSNTDVLKLLLNLEWSLYTSTNLKA